MARGGDAAGSCAISLAADVVNLRTDCVINAPLSTVDDGGGALVERRPASRVATVGRLRRAGGRLVAGRWRLRAGVFGRPAARSTRRRLWIASRRPAARRLPQLLQQTIRRL